MWASEQILLNKSDLKCTTLEILNSYISLLALQRGQKASTQILFGLQRQLSYEDNSIVQQQIRYIKWEQHPLSAKGTLPEGCKFISSTTWSTAFYTSLLFPSSLYKNMILQKATAAPQTRPWQK